MVNSKTQEILLEKIEKRYDFEISRIKRLDDKTNNILTVDGIIAALISGFGSLSVSFSEITFIEWGAFLVFALSLVIIVASLWYGLKAYQLRDYMIVPDPPVLIGECEKMKPEEVIETLKINYALAVIENEPINNEKASNITKAIQLTLISLILFALFSFLTILSK